MADDAAKAWAPHHGGELVEPLQQLLWGVCLDNQHSVERLVQNVFCGVHCCCCGCCCAVGGSGGCGSSNGGGWRCRDACHDHFLQALHAGSRGTQAGGRQGGQQGTRERLTFINGCTHALDKMVSSSMSAVLH